MADTVELPNVDIFDPVQCARRWAECATQQQINVYLNKQIDVNRKVLTDTITAQNKLNASYKDGIAGHETRIADLESRVTALDKAQSDLKTAFEALTTDNNNFKLNVDNLLNQYQTTINLLTTNIDKISTSNEQLWNEVNTLKGQFDPDKLNAAIAGYEGVLSDAKKYTDEQVEAEGKRVDGNLNNVATELASLQKQITDNNTLLTQTVTENNNAIIQRFNTLSESFNVFSSQQLADLAKQREWCQTEFNRIDKTAAALAATVADNKQAAADDLSSANKTLTALIQQTADNAQAALDKEVATLNDALSDEQKARLAADGELDKRVTAVESAIKAISASDEKQWTTINAILEAQNTVNASMQELKTYVNEQIELVKSDIAGIKSNSDKQQAQIDSINKQLSAIDLNAGKGQVIATFKGDDPIIAASTTSLDGINITTAKTSAAAYNNVQMSVTADAGIGGVYVVPAVEYGRPQSMPMGNTIVNPNNTNSNRVEMEFFKEGWQVNAKLAVFYNASTKLVQFIYYPPIENETVTETE